MRISRFLLPTVVLAGALALAGCGGGDDPMDDMDMDDTAMDDTDMDDKSDPEVKTTDPLPNDGTLTAGPSGTTFTVPAGGNLRVQGVWYSCTGPEPCVATVPAGAVVDRVSYTGGTLAVSSSDPRATAGSTGGNASQPATDEDPLSAATIAEALKATGKKATIWGEAGDGAVDFSTGTQIRVTVDGETVRLTLAGNAALHWGYWHRYKAPATPPPAGKRTAESAGAIYGGTMSRYGVRPDDGIDTATYDDGSVELYFKNGSGAWTDGGATNAELDLRANFREGKVGGQITGVAGALTGVGLTGDAADIVLEETDIGSAGTFSGNAKFEDGDTFSRRSGGWNGAFFGPTASIPTQGNRAVPVAPSHVAGTFTVSGRHGTTPADLHVRGAFGSED